MSEYYQQASYYNIEKHDYTQNDVNTAHIAMMISGYMKGGLDYNDVLPLYNDRHKKPGETEDAEKIFNAFNSLANTINKGK